MTDIWTLSVMSFKGTVPGAVHAYGVLSGPHDRAYKISEVLDQERADELNAHAERVGKNWLEVAADDPNEFFMREEDLEECARIAFLFLAPPDALLMRGMAPDVNPSKVLHGPAELMAKLNEIYEQDEALSDRDPKREDLDIEWMNLIKEHGLTCDAAYHPHENFTAIVERRTWLERPKSPIGYDASVKIESRW